MNIVVLIAGVHDPKWPITPAAALAAGEHQVMSPFDEAALEVALRLRDGNPAVQVRAVVAGGAEAMKIARAVVALNVADVSLVALARSWDQLATARALASLCGGADLVLIGREFGDLDDGLVPPVLAGLLERPFFGRAQAVEAGEFPGLTREAEACVERLALERPAVVSVTNDRRTRLRKPLMKNVMMARQAQIGTVAVEADVTAGLAVAGLSERVAVRGSGACAMIAGDAAQQARTLASLLWEARV